MRTVVLLHGAWHGAWCWTPITTRLAARGIPSVAVDLEGHGLLARRPADPAGPSPVAHITASSAAGLLIDQLRAIGGGVPCVVVAHSMGGVVATAAAERAPELFDHLVYVAALAPLNSHPTAGYLSLPESAGDRIPGLLTADPAAVGALRVDGTGPGVHDAFYGDVDPGVADAARTLLTPDFPFGIATETVLVTPGRFGSVAHSYVVCEQDYAVRPALQRRLIDELDAVSAAPAKVFTLDSAHSPFLSRPGELTDVIASVW
ncbi:alpha/beta fold hydrolase [Symbioplanes lichenis]|uniref:alpha/beta fold hydrolase n=1 Tax=Symbioplanes lichenis TaxID=1629072 RepID=UPI0027386F9E|nr:alpha/beta fold hydrolase [Actinoplanes lichenis]